MQQYYQYPAAGGNSAHVQELEQRLANAEALIAQLVAASAAKTPAGAVEEVSEEEPDSEGELVTVVQSNGDEIRAGIATRGPCYFLSASTWDACLFIGLPCLDRFDSVLVGILALLSFLAQAFFCRVVLTYMLDGDLDSEALDGLLRFRTSVAHHITFADKGDFRSLASQICDGDKKLPWGSLQYDVIDKLGDYRKAGPELCLIAVGCWLAVTLKELFQVISFTQCICMKKVGDRTILAETAERGDDERQETDKSIVLDQLYSMRRWFLLLGIAVPRLWIAITLMVTGVRYLCITVSLPDLILNSVALAFILDLDNLVMEAFAPRRARNLLEEVGYLRMPSSRLFDRLSRNAGVFSPEHWKNFSKLFLLLLGLLLSYVLLIKPTHAQTEMAHNILCSGNLDFVYVENPATQIVEATRSFKEPGALKAVQKTVLQLAKPDIYPIPGWDVTQEQVDRFSENVTPAIFRENQYSKNKADLQSIRRFMVTSTASFSEAARSLACNDAAYGHRIFAPALLKVTGGAASRCKDPAVLKLCSHGNMSAVRSLCPVTCGCDNPFDPKAAVFSAPVGGCPNSCELAKTSVIEQRWDYPCRDVDPQDFLAPNGGSENYVTGVFEVAVAQPEIRNAVAWKYADQLNRTFKALSFMPPGTDGVSYMAGLVESFKNGSWRDAILAGKWDLAEGIPHPRHLTGCKFLTSWEFQSLLGLDLCDPGQFNSLRMRCPVSCRCFAGRSGCPVSCTYSR